MTLVARPLAAAPGRLAVALSAAEVRALIQGCKSQLRLPTRVPRKPRMVRVVDNAGLASAPSPWLSLQPGEKIAVREPLGWDNRRQRLFYRADGAEVEIDEMRQGAVAPSRLHARYMPLWTLRLTLIVTGTRIERLAEISEEDAIAEGIRPIANGRYAGGVDDKLTFGSAVEAFRRRWSDTHDRPSESWDENPEVIVVGIALSHG